MKYYNYEMRKREIDTLLQKYFDDNYGAVITFDLNNNVDVIEICKLTKEDNATTWTHYANVCNMDTSKNNNWELNEQFIKIDEKFCNRWGDEYRVYIGTEQTAMNIYGYFKTLGGAIRNLAKNGTSENGRKPITIYV